MRSQLIILVPTALIVWFLEQNTWNVINPWLPHGIRWPLRIVFYLFGLSPLLLSIIAESLPEPLSNAVSDYFYYHLLLLFYLFIVTLLLLGVARLLAILGIDSYLTLPWASPLSILLVFAITGGIMLWGSYRAAYPSLTHLDLSLNKPGAVSSLRILAISDIHWETLVNHNVVERAVNLINSRNPDIVVILGDTVTRDCQPFLSEGGPELFATLRSKYGAYVVLGNHDFYDNRADDLEAAYEDAGLHVLRDEAVLIADSLWLVGREDVGGMRGLTRRDRMPLNDLLKLTDPGQAVLVLDHQPRDLEQNAALGIDLELSGHTHAGQLWPITLITERIYELNYGMKKIGDTTFFVTAGIGYWGPPLRIGSKAEVLEIDLFFSNTDSVEPNAR